MMAAQWRSGRTWGRWGLIAVLIVAGLAVGIAGSFVHRAARPAGIALALGATIAVMLLTRAVAHSRLGVALVGAAWLVPVSVLAAGTAEGDLVIAADPIGLTFLFGGVLAISLFIGLGAVGDDTSGARTRPDRALPESGAVS